MDMGDESDNWEAEWRDVSPIPQNDGPRPAVPIAYTAAFVRVMGYFRAALAADERSPRSLRLTARVIDLNAANYTAWHFRRLCLEATGASLEDELEYLDDLLEEHQKNYQLWHHRRWVAQCLGPAAAPRELRFSEAALAHGDSKNYHIWSHRQWVLRELGGHTWQQEMEVCGRLLDMDVYNNSAWNQRMFVLQTLFPGAPGKRNGKDSTPAEAHSPSSAAATASSPAAAEAEPSSLSEAEAGPMSSQDAERVFNEEAAFVLASIQGTPANESAWAYLQGLFKWWGRSLSAYEPILAFCKELVGEDKGTESEEACQHALSLLLDVLCAGADPKTIADASGMEGASVSKGDVGTRLCERLQVVDKMRWNYWEMRKQLVSESQA